MNVEEWEQNSVFCVDSAALDAADCLRDALLACLAVEDRKRELVLVCIGTDRATGDSLGPLTGHKLAAITTATVYGTLETPIHAQNLRERMAHIHAAHRDPLVIAVDACLGRCAHVGWLTVARRPVQPGAAVRKRLPSVGDISVMGTVGGGVELFALQNTRLYMVMRMADAIADGIAGALHMHKENRV